MYYGMISPTVGVCLVRVNGNLNALGYEEILFDHLQGGAVILAALCMITACASRKPR